MNNRPNLRFKEFEGHWESKHLSQFTERVTRKNKNCETELPLTISALDGLIDQREYFNRQVASKDMSGYYLLKRGEFAYNKSYSNGFPFGSIKRLNKYEKGALSTLYICFNSKNIDSDFLEIYFDTDKWHKEVYMIALEGARNHGLLNIPIDEFLNTLHKIPSQQEQEKIAKFLNKVDELISEQAAKVTALENQKKGLMQKLFSQTLRFTDSNNNPYPDWEEKTLGDVSSNFKAGNSITSDNIFDESLYPVYGGNGLRGYTTQKTHEGTFVLIGRQGALCGNVNFVSGQMYISEHAVAVIASDNNAAKFLYYLFGYMNLNNYSESSAQPGLSVNKIIKLKRFFPCKEEQEKIANILTKIDELIEENKALLISWQQFKKGLLQQMFV